MPDQLPCGCCRAGCICADHAPDRVARVCEFHDGEIDWYALSNGITTVMPDGTIVHDALDRQRGDFDGF